MLVYNKIKIKRKEDRKPETVYTGNEQKGARKNDYEGEIEDAHGN